MKAITVWIADVQSLVGQEQKALDLLTPGRREVAQRLKPEQDRLRSLAAGLLLRHVLGVSSDEDLRKTEFGKLKLTADGPCFNLSHGGSYAVLAVGDLPLGVDVEPIGERVPVSISSRFLRSEEREWLARNPGPEKFAWLWTRLESALKADGRGFALEQRSFSVLESGTPWHFETISRNGHMISCAAREPFELSVCEISVDSLISP